MGRNLHLVIEIIRPSVFLKFLVDINVILIKFLKLTTN